MPHATPQRTQSTLETTGRPRSGGRARSETARVGNRAVGRLMLGAHDTAHERGAERAAEAVVGGRVVGQRPQAVRGGAEPLPARVEREIDAARGGGRPLAGPVRRRLQRSLSADVGRVRVHTDARAHRISAGIDAEAATVGHDIFFRRGRFRPRSVGGLRTLAHEVVHTLQQGSDAAVVQRERWRWDKPYTTKDKTLVWTDGWKVNADLLADIGPGLAKSDCFDDVSRMYIPFDPKADFGKGAMDFSRQRVIPTGEMIEKRETRDLARTTAGKTLKNCKTLSALSAKLGEAGYNYSTVPDRYIEATSDYTRFKKKKTWYGGDRAKLACRLALRDLATGVDLGSDPATDYMARARGREESTDKSIGLSGKFKWTPFGDVDSTDFGKWAVSGRGEPGNRGTMNCWESVIFGAFKAGHLSREQVRDAYLEVRSIGKSESVPRVRPDDGPRLKKEHEDTSDPSFMIPIEQLLTRGRPREYKLHDPDTERPLKGDIIAYGTFGKHVAVAEGNSSGEPQVVSLYDKPNSITSVQRVPISSFMGSGGFDHTRTWMYRPFWA